MKWSIVNHQLSLYDSEHRLIDIDAKSIYASVFGHDLIDISGTKAPDIRKDIPDLKFSKYPAEPFLLVTNNQFDEIVISVVTNIDNITTEIQQGIDHIVINNKWFPIDLSTVSSIIELLEEKSIIPNEAITLGQLIYLRKLDSEIRLIEDPGISFDRPNEKPTKTCKTIDGLNADLYPYQQDGVGFLNLVSNQSIGCILADEMGLGKTLQIIALLQLEKLAGRNQSLIIAPATLLENWRREIKQFAPGLTVFVHAGPNRPGVSDALLGFDAVLVSYETAIRDEPLLGSIKWNILALDEAQNIKNPSAQRTSVVKILPRRVSIAVSGTPMENRLEDLWSISDFALQGILGTLDEFQSNYANHDDDASKIAPIVSPVILRRLVKDVAKDLPDKIEIPQPILMTATLASSYEQLRLETLEEYGRAASMVATTKLRVLCAHPSLSAPWHHDPAHEMPKYQRTIELFDEIFSKNEKVLLFTTYQGMVDLFLGDMPVRWPKAYFNFIDGRVAIEERQHIVDEFFDHPGYGALFLNPKAAGTGLNITAANHVIHYNPEWNPALTEQASRRAYRRKQEKPVTIHHLYFANTLEELIMDRANFKRSLAESAVTGHDGSIDSSIISEALQISPLTGTQQE